MKLPPYEDLSPEQDDAINLPLDGRYLISGPPGSGKTVVALYRAQMAKRSRRVPVVLTYSRLLRQFMQPWMDDLLLDGAVDTFNGWLWSFYLGNYRRRPPQLSKYNADWHAVVNQLTECPPTKDCPDQLIVDEGQDLCREFYFATALVCPSILVLADENQRITTTQSTLQDIQIYARITKAVTLTRNYRNTREIAAVAAHFYSGLRTGIPDPPQTSGPKPVMSGYAGRDDEIAAIARFAGNHASQTIGVLVPTIDAREDAFRRLGRAPTLHLQQYVGGQGSNGTPLDFSRPSITLATYASAKGLEFETVFLPYVDLVKDEAEATKMKFYVLCSRPRKELYVSFAGGGVPAMAASFPRDLMDWRA